MTRLIVFIIIIGSVVVGLSYSMWGGEEDQVEEITLENKESILVDEKVEEEDTVEKIKNENTIASQIVKRENNLINDKENMQLEKIEGFHPEKNMILEEGKKYSAKIKTSAGDMVVELNKEDVPVTVNNFVYLSKTGFYEGVIFHRVIKDFMIQGGDPTGSGSGGPGYKFNDEKFNGEYAKGTLAMANAGPNTNGSQFFIMHGDVDLPPSYTIFGKVIEGLDIVDKIANAEVVAGGEGSSPVEPVVIESVEILEK